MIGDKVTFLFWAKGGTYTLSGIAFKSHKVAVRRHEMATVVCKEEVCLCASIISI